MTQNPHDAGVPGACPDVDTLADLHAGVLDDVTARTLRAHAASCEACTEVLAALDATVASLGSMPSPQIPPDVAARLDRALAIEAGRVDPGHGAGGFSAPPTSADVRRLPVDRSRGTASPTDGPGSAVASLAAHRERRAGRGRLLMAAAAAAAVLGIGTLVITQNGNGSTSTQAASQSTATDASPGRSGNGTVQSFSSPKDVLERGAIQNDQVAPEVAGKMAELAERNKCLSQIIPRPAAAPEAVEAGSHNGTKAYAFVFPTKDPDIVEMIIVDAADCSVRLDTVTGPRK
ncbi:anti-sigma factor family protein [Cumulibacter manganitolerans]|uniref:anti-sigma factor family protein n=1 Tax=Cumulibacter manganitolerans TaxID=1884992 RepID=UPI001294DD06|nr:hypothetical protein [Cumulibacter manganitolerans]